MQSATDADDDDVVTMTALIANTQKLSTDLYAMDLN